MLKNSFITSFVGIFLIKRCQGFSHVTVSTIKFFVALFLILAAGFSPGDSAYAESELTIQLTSNPYIEFDVVPDTFNSGSVTFNASTNDTAGYSLYLKSNGLNLIHEDIPSEQISPITLPSGNTTGLLPANFSGNTYGFSMDGNYYLPLTNAAALNGQNIYQSNTAGTNSHTISYGMRADLNAEAGTYELTVDIIVVANQHSYIINYDKNTTASVSNMPATNPDEGLINIDTPINIPNTIPIRNKYNFVGWDTNPNLNPSTSTPAYPAGGQILPDFTNEASFEMTLYAIWAPKTYNVVFHSNYIAEGESEEDNSAMPPAAMPIPTKAALPKNLFTRTGYSFKHWNTAADDSGTIYVDRADVTGLAAENQNFHLYAIWVEGVEEYSYEGTCSFNGGTTLTGACNPENDVDTTYIDTGITPFNDDNVDRNFDLKFTVGSNLDFTTIEDTYGGTLVNALYEIENSTVYFPGFTIRVRNNKFQIHSRIGLKSQNPIVAEFESEEILGKQFRVFRHHDNQGRNLLYIQVGDDTPIFYADLTNLVTTFNTSITLGATIDPKTDEPFRPLIGDISDFSFTYLDDGLTYEEIAFGSGYVPPVNDMTLVFSATGPCKFNGNNGLMEGENCVSNGPTNGKFINTGVNLFDLDNINKDFIINVSLGSDYGATTQDESQVTIIGSEYPSNNYPGLVVRRSSNKLQVNGGQRTGQKGSVVSTLNASEINHISLMRRNHVVCYSFNHEPYQLLYDYTSFTNYFAQPVYFGGASNNTDLQNPTSKRVIKGTLSNMTIETGTINPESPDCKFD